MKKNIKHRICSLIEKFRLSNILLVLVSGYLFFSVNTQLFSQTKALKKVEYYKVSEVRIFINAPSDVSELRKQGLSFEHIKLNDTYFDVSLDSIQISKLKKTGYSYEIIIDDLTKDYLERTKESRGKIIPKKAGTPLGFGLGSMGGFYTFSEVVALLDSMRVRYPNLISAKDSIGSSVEGRTLWAVKISDNTDVKENEPEVFYNSLIHGNEQQGMMILIYFMYHLLENYGTDPEVTYLVNNRELYFLPVINPDGYTYNEQISPDGGGMWRRNRRDCGGGIFGVDLNRNFGYKWGIDNIGSDPNPGGFGYRGTGPFSEPESQVIRDFCISHNFIISNSFHTPMTCVFPPWGYNLAQTEDSLEFNSLIQTATAINEYRNGIYILPPENFPVNGYGDDWMYGDTIEKNRIFGVTTEASNYEEGFWPIPERITPLAAEHLYLNMVLAWGNGIIENPPYVSDGTINLTYCNPQTNTLLRFNAVEHNPDNHTSQVYAQLINAKDSLVSETLLAQTDSNFSGSLEINSLDEDFYKVRYKQSGTDIPSNLYYCDNSKLQFTNVGPVVLDSISIVKNATSYSVKTYIRNNSAVVKITKPSVKLSCSDAWAKPITSNVRSLADISPGGIVSNSSSFTVKTIDSLFGGYFNFNVEVSSNGYYYWTDSAKITITGINKEQPQVAFSLGQNFPNPFNSVTTITWQLAYSSKVTLKVYDLLGRKVTTLVDEQRPAGEYETRFDAVLLPKGIYFYELKAGGFSQTRKMIVLE